MKENFSVMLVTFFSDASLCPDTGCAGWAAWIKSDRGSHREDGVIRRRTLDTSVAEAMAVINGLHIALRKKLLLSGDRILVQTDCNSVMPILTGETKRRVTRKARAKRGISYKELRHEAKNRNDEIREIAYIYAKIVEHHGIEVVWRHCKGHRGQEDRRAAVNSVCDTRAKAKMREARKEHIRQGGGAYRPKIEEHAAG